MLGGFESLSLSAPLLKAVSTLGYTSPTEVQQASIPVLLSGRDLVAQSKTGSGKTAAFTLPVLEALRLEERSVQALVVCPTRELCSQVVREIRKLGRGQAGLAVLELCGGQPIKPQIAALERGVHIVVGTPGRLLDHVNRSTFPAAKIRTVVLDEADRMLDMGFGADVETILEQLPKDRQTALFSATFPPSIESICRRYLRDPARVAVTVADVEESVGGTRHFQLNAQPEDKQRALFWALANYSHETALVFCNFKATVATLLRELDLAGVSAERLDGDLEQYHRDQVLARFRNQSIRVLVATDVAGRGLDVEGLDLVVNYEFPQKPSAYVHRAGRTGRAGKTGIAVSLITDREKSKVSAVEALAQTQLERVKWNAASGTDLQALTKQIARRAPMETLLISGGRKDKVRPGDILGALTGDSGGLAGTDIGKIEIQDRLSYVAVARDVSAKALDALNRGRIKGKRFRVSLVGPVSSSPKPSRGPQRNKGRKW